MAEDYSGIDTSNDVLEHHGRMGMKWYKHIFGDDPRWGNHGRTTGNKQREGTTPPKDYAEDNNQPVHDKDGEKKSVKDRYHGAHKPVSMMSYQELSDSIDRMNMEKKYRDLMNELNPKPQKKTSRLEKIANKAVDSLADAGIKIGVDYIEDGIRKSLGLKERKDPIINLKDFRKDPSKYEGKLTNKQLKDLGDAAKAENKAKGHSDDYEEDRSLNVTDFMRNPEKYKYYEFTNKDLDNIEKYGKTYNKYYGEKDTDNSNNRTERTANVNSNTDYMQDHRRRMNEAVQQYKKEHPNTKLNDDDIAESLGYTGGYVSYGVFEMDRETLQFLQHVGIDTTDILTDDFLEHHGIKGMKWGVRRYQNPDGSLTPEGQKRYNQFVSDVKRHGGKAGAIASVTRSANTKSTAVGLASTAGLLASVGIPMAAVASAPTFAAAATAMLGAPIGMFGTMAVSNIANRIIENNAQKKIADIKDIKEIADTYVDRPTVDSRNDAYSESSSQRYADGKTKKQGDTFVDKNGHYGWDHDGNMIYNKTKTQIADEKAGNRKLDNITNDQYARLDQDLFYIGSKKYAEYPLKTRQKLIRDYSDSILETGKDPYAAYNHAKVQTIRNDYEEYMNAHPNSELTFNEFNDWYYQDQD